jgi:UDP-glucose 4-epimerase
MRVLVTGATGFVGRALVPALLERGITVRAAARNHQRVDDRAERFAHGDLASPVAWDEALRDVHTVVHLAGLAHASDVLQDERYDRVNHLATARLAEAAAAAKVQRFVFVSSIRAQTAPVATKVLSEADEPRPTDAYGRSKLAAEQAIVRTGVPATILRPVLVCGEDAKGNLATLLRIAKLPIPLPFGSMENRRSLLSLDNLLSAVVHVMETPSSAGKIYVVADPEPLTLKQIIESLRAGLQRPPRLVRFPRAVLRPMVRMSLGKGAWDRFAGQLIVDPSLLMRDGWKPTTDTKATLRELACPR